MAWRIMRFAWNFVFFSLQKMVSKRSEKLILKIVGLFSNYWIIYIISGKYRIFFIKLSKGIEFDRTKRRIRNLGFIFRK